MIYLSITQIDSGTKIICTKEPMRNGPSFPEIKNLNIIWCNKSIWPIQTNSEGAHIVAPLFFGTCDDDANLSVAGVVATYTQEEYSALKTAEHQARKPYPSWIGDEETMTWSPPILYPNDNKIYKWNETTVSWDKQE